MLCHMADTGHVPLSECTAADLDARALEFQLRAATATGPDRQALLALVGRYRALAKRRCAEEHDAHKATRADTPMGLPSALALQMAADAIGRMFVLPETRDHPAVQAASMELAYFLMAYGLVPPELPEQPVVTEEPHAGEDVRAPFSVHHQILVVDDVPDVLVTIGAFLVGAAFAVRKAEDAEVALRLIAADPSIDMLITDLATLGVNGTELIAQAAKVRPDIRTLVITGYPNAPELAKLPPPTTVLVKPFRRDELIAWVKASPVDRPRMPHDTLELVR